MPPITAPDAVIALPVMHGAGGTPVPHSHTQTPNLQSTLGSTAQSSQPLHQPLSHPWFGATWALTNPDEASLHTWMRTDTVARHHPTPHLDSGSISRRAVEIRPSCLVTMDRIPSRSLLQSTPANSVFRRDETTEVFARRRPGDKPPDEPPGPAPWSYRLGGYAL
jgi:hypothetical protein